MEQLLLQYGPYALIIYIIVKDVVPKILPDVAKIWSKKLSLEDRLFKVLDDVSKTNKETAVCLSQVSSSLGILAAAVHSMDIRVAVIEQTVVEQKALSIQHLIDKIAKERHV